MNFVIIMGRVTADIELRATASGKSVTNFNLAVDRQFAKDTTDFITCSAWDRTAETISKYVKKGQKIIVRGSLQNREWQDKQGNKRVSAEVVVQEFFFCDSKANNATNNTTATIRSVQSEFQPQPFIPTAYTAQTQTGFEDIASDPDLPF